MKVTIPDPWDRQPGESEPAWAAFVTYRDMGSARSAREVGRRLQKNGELIGRWCARWGWVERVAAWEREQDRARRESDLQAVRDMTRRQAEQARGAQVALSAPLRELADRIKSGKLDLSKLTPGELVKLAAVVAPGIARMMEEERKARGVAELLDLSPDPRGARGFPAGPAPVIGAPEVMVGLEAERALIAAVAPSLTREQQEVLIAAHSGKAGISVPAAVIDVSGGTRGETSETPADDVATEEGGSR